MKFLLINGSPKANGNTFHACDFIKKKLEAQGIETEIYNLANKTFNPCLGCRSCFNNQNLKCVINDDLSDLIANCQDIDGIILGSPIHYADIAGIAKNAFDRLFYVSSANGNIFRHKVGASFVVVRRAGGIAGFQTLNNYLLYSEMFIASSTYWNIVYGATPEEIYCDAEGTSTLECLANNLAYLAKSLKESTLAKPPVVEKIRTNFVRDDLK